MRNEAPSSITGLVLAAFICFVAVCLICAAPEQSIYISQ
jgi:hypothetical protein